MTGLVTKWLNNWPTRPKLNTGKGKRNVESNRGDVGCGRKGKPEPYANLMRQYVELVADHGTIIRSPFK
jgi:hypothetical protein